MTNSQQPDELQSGEVCICGHDHLWPDSYFGKQRADDCFTSGCDCGNFRACLPWPDSEGWWIVDWPLDKFPCQPVLAYRATNGPHQGELCIVRVAYNQNEFRRESKPGRFFKSDELGDNPFDFLTTLRTPA